MLHPTTFTFSPEQFIRQWIAMIPPPEAGDGRFDYNGFTSALVELVADEQWRQATSDRMESAGDVVLDICEGGLAEIVRELATSREFIAAAERVAWAFDRQGGLDPAHPDAAAVRRDLVRQFGEAIVAPFEARELRRQESRERAERRLYEREPILTDLLPEGNEGGDDEYVGLTAPAREPDPGSAVAGRECADRVLAAVREKIRPVALAALGTLLAEPDDRPAYAIARERGISPATITRAMKLLASIARTELADLPPDALTTFNETLLTGLRP